MLYGERMRETSVAGTRLWLDPAEAGGRYLAPILILPGLFQSPACWRGITSMLAHRGWNVYLLPRSAATTDNGSLQNSGWSESLATAARVASNLDTKVIVFGADIGASLALALPTQIRPLALALFGPAEPRHVAGAYQGTLAFLARRRAQPQSDVAAPASLSKTAPRPSDPGTEPGSFLADMNTVVTSRPNTHPPAIVFAPTDDPLVDARHAASFADTPYAKLARTKLAGRWWPSTRWEPIADEVHRFLILTLADRVVEFPDEIIED